MRWNDHMDDKKPGDCLKITEELGFSARAYDRI
jgi:hypothetical protein